VEKSSNKVSKVIVVATLCLSAILLPSSAMKTTENTKEEPDYPEPADEGDIQMEHSSD
jgi:hypothetical protein